MFLVSNGEVPVIEQLGNRVDTVRVAVLNQAGLAVLVDFVERKNLRALEVGELVVAPRRFETKFPRLCGVPGIAKEESLRILRLIVDESCIGFALRLLRSLSDFVAGLLGRLLEISVSVAARCLQVIASSAVDPLYFLLSDRRAVGIHIDLGIELGVDSGDFLDKEADLLARVGDYVQGCVDRFLFRLDREESRRYFAGIDRPYTALAFVAAVDIHDPLTLGYADERRLVPRHTNTNRFTLSNRDREWIAWRGGRQ